MQVIQRPGFGRLHSSTVSSTHCQNSSSISKSATPISSQNANPSTISTTTDLQLLPNSKGKVSSTLEGTGLQKASTVSSIQCTRKGSRRPGCEDLNASKNSSTKHLTAYRVAKQGTSSPKYTRKLLQVGDAQSKHSDTVSATPQELSGVQKTCGATLTVSTRKMGQISGCRKKFSSNNSSTKHLVASREAKQAIRDCFEVAKPETVAPKLSNTPLETTDEQSMHRTKRTRKPCQISGNGKLCAHKNSSTNYLIPSRKAKQATRNCSQETGTGHEEKQNNQRNCTFSTTSKSNASACSYSTSAPDCSSRKLKIADAQSMHRTVSNYQLPPTSNNTISATLQRLSDDGIVGKTFTTFKNSSTNRLVASSEPKKAARICSQDAGSGTGTGAGAGAGAKKYKMKPCHFSSNSKASGCSNSSSAPECSSRQLETEDRQSMLRTGRNLQLPPSLEDKIPTTLQSLLEDGIKLQNTYNTALNKCSRRPNSSRTSKKIRFSFLDRPWNSSSSSPVNEFASICNTAFGRRGVNGRNAPTRKEGNLLFSSYSTGIADDDREEDTDEDSQSMEDDQHWELRMDIDNMSYEELLDLEEQMGSVSTGLTDEARTKCIKRIYFKMASSASETLDCVPNGKSCSICQEECVDGEEIGILDCEHWFHAFCIEQWLRLKNWCPICKASAQT